MGEAEGEVRGDGELLSDAWRLRTFGDMSGEGA